jgi:hypothetical protein
MTELEQFRAMLNRAHIFCCEEESDDYGFGSRLLRIPDPCCEEDTGEWLSSTCAFIFDPGGKLIAAWPMVGMPTSGDVVSPEMLADLDGSI